MEIKGGGFLVLGGSRLTIVDSNITDTIGGMMGGVFAVNGGILEISRSHIEGATAQFLGAFIAGSGSTTVVTIRDSVVRNIGKQDSWSWNGITLWDGPTMKVSGCSFDDSPKGVFYLAKVRCRPPGPTRHLTELHQPFSAHQLFYARGRRLTSLSPCAFLLVKGIGHRRQLPL